MTQTEIIEFLRAHEGERILVTWSDGESQRVDVHGVDQEGFLHSGPDSIEQRDWWTRWEFQSDARSTVLEPTGDCVGRAVCRPSTVVARARLPGVNPSTQ